MESLVVLNTGPLGVNTYIVPLAKDAVLIVDPAACTFTDDETKITGWLDEHKKRPAGIFLTHSHFDHITGLAVLKKAFPDCAIAVHKSEACMLNGEAQVASFGLRQLAAAFQDMPRADKTVAGGETLDAVFTDERDAEVAAALSQWKILHTPGHSTGSLCLYNAERGELISGDTVFYRSYGRTDLPGGDEAAIHKSLLTLKETLPRDTRVYPGHDYYGFPLSENY
ncbi:MAG: MBL fold metallo-hydrolase [Treponema sp.]|nr:MBL fold metallo-hydrolase [Treponema sp.]